MIPIYLNLLRTGCYNGLFIRDQTVLHIAIRDFYVLNSPIYLQVLVEPGNGLTEGLFLSPLLLGVAQIGAHSEAVADTAEQVDLPRLGSLDKNLFGFMTKLGSEDRVGLC
jgi:hypothetical protein